MKKQYLAPKSENVNLDPLMVTFSDPGPVSINGGEEGTQFDE